jgi:hypothetical protein
MARARRRRRGARTPWREALRRLVPSRWRGPLAGRWPAAPEARRWRAWLGAVRRWPRGVWIPLVLAAAVALGVARQVARKPTELLGAVAPASPKTPESTWRAYGPLFGAHATEVVTPGLLAALAQVESAGDPLATPPWRFHWSWNPLDVYGPPSSAVGLLQLTDGAYADARRLCIHEGQVARAGPWYDPRGCWLNALYLRTVPSHAIEMTAAALDDAVAQIVSERLLFGATLAQRRRLAAVVHLCGRERGAAFAERGFRPRPGERCGEHDLARYVARVEGLQREFERIAAGR